MRPHLPYLCLLHPVLLVGWLGKTETPALTWKYRDLAGAFLILFELAFVGLVLALLKLPWPRLWFRILGMALLFALSLLGLRHALVREDSIVTTLFASWLGLLAPSLLLLFRQRGSRDA